MELVLDNFCSSVRVNTEVGVSTRTATANGSSTKTSIFRVTPLISKIISFLGGGTNYLELVLDNFCSSVRVNTEIGVSTRTATAKTGAAPKLVYSV